MEKSDNGPLIVSVGQVGVELLGVVHRLPDHGQPVEMRETTVQVGGHAAVAAGAAAALGCRTRLACKLADDFLGGFVLAALREAGVETRGALDPDRQLSPFAFTALEGPGGPRAPFYTHGDAGALDPAELDVESLLAGAGAVLIDGTYPQAQEALAQAARSRKVPVILDASAIGSSLGTLVGLADVLLCSERLAGELSPHDAISDALVDIQKLGPSAVIITLGEAGSVGLHGEELVEQAAFPIDEAVDTTSAGSVYHGAFAAALLSNLPFARCMRFASAAASLSCGALGPWAGIPHRQQVEELAATATSE